MQDKTRTNNANTQAQVGKTTGSLTLSRSGARSFLHQPKDRTRIAPWSPDIYIYIFRVLEYYAGILFLTTNRIGDFDEAFTSRIHISLYYPPLDKSSTREIFRLNLRIIKQRFLDKGRDIDIREKDILKYATAYWKKHENMRWNGRQIRNACQTALAMAEQRLAPLNGEAGEAEAGDPDGSKQLSPVNGGEVTTVILRRERHKTHD
ncbi:hypothetical protein CCMA1212_002022 [Trichoderma ghanense]|uniref:AAA+ ATPase lid domain-containing protein n=1 Tax=Trichoderma ghanense TaxID=65468 RepID=A0ABY2HBW3_9HYPO